jgi:hypothetical protein
MDRILRVVQQSFLVGLKDEHHIGRPGNSLKQTIPELAEVAFRTGQEEEDMCAGPAVATNTVCHKEEHELASAGGDLNNRIHDFVKFKFGALLREKICRQGELGLKHSCLDIGLVAFR